MITKNRTVLLTLDLKHTPGEIRAKFNGVMEEKGWAKVENIDTAWMKTFRVDEGTPSGSAMQAAKDEVVKVAESAKVPSYFAVVQAGPSKPGEFDGPSRFR